MPRRELATALRNRFDPFRPAIALMRRMRIRAKFLIIAALFIVPLVLSAAVFERRLDADLRRIEHQQTGLRYGRTLLPISEALQDRRAASDAALRGNADAAMQLHEVNATLGAALLKMGGVDVREGAALDLNARWADVMSLWQSVQALPPSTSAPVNYESHTELLRATRALLQASLDRSHLALDQDVVVDHAVHAGFEQAQSLIESLAAMRTLAVSALEQRSLSDADRTLLRGATERVRIYHAELRATLERLFESTPALRETLAEALEGAAQAERFTNVVEKAVLNASSISMPAAPVASLGMKATKSVQQISLAVVDHIELTLSRRHGSLKRTRLMLIAASSLLVLSACYLLVAFIRAMRLDLSEVERRLDDIASGVLTGKSVIDGHDEFAALLRRVDTAQERLLALIRDVQSGAEHVDRAAQQIATENAELSERTNRMVSSLQQASQSALELARSVNDGSGRVAELDEMANHSSQVASEAGRIVDQVVGRIESISTSSHKIEKIIATVDAITFQTRLLSLNAAVEAARAGEHGRSFAVVATEVRELAARSQNASSEIRALVQASLNEVGTGMRLASDAHAQMRNVVAAARKLSDVIGKITQAAQEQSASAVKIAPLLQQVQADSGHNAERVDQVAVAANELDEMARGLKESMSRFHIDAKAA